MLVLSRGLRQRVFLGEDVVLTVLEISGNKVRLGIDAPRSLRILREEVKLKLESEVAHADSNPPSEQGDHVTPDPDLQV